MKKILWAVAAVLAGAVAVACGVGATTSGGTSEVTVTTDASPEVSVAAKPSTVKVKAWGAGVYKVGEDIQPGSYKTAGADSSCYWARLKDDSGGVGTILANDLMSPNSPGRMSVKATDKFIEFTGDCQWIKA